MEGGGGRGGEGGGGGGEGGGGGVPLTTTGEGICPACCLPFDSGRKRKLIDSCGHGRCYSCMFSNEVCPLCVISGYTFPPTSVITTTSMSETSLSASDLPEVMPEVLVRSFRRSESSGNDSTEPVSDVIIPERAASKVVPQTFAGTKTPPPPPPTPNLPRYIQPILPPNVSPSLYLSQLHPDSQASDQHHHHHLHLNYQSTQQPPPHHRRPHESTRSDDSEQIPSPSRHNWARPTDEKDQHHDTKAQKPPKEHPYVENFGQEFGERHRRNCSSDPSAGPPKDGKNSRGFGEGQKPNRSSRNLGQSVSGENLGQDHRDNDVKKSFAGEKMRHVDDNENLGSHLKREKPGQFLSTGNLGQDNRRDNSGQNDNRERVGPRYISDNLRLSRSENLEHSYRHDNSQRNNPNLNHSHENFGQNFDRNRERQRNRNENRGQNYNENLRQNYTTESSGRANYSSDSALGSPDFATTASTAGTTTTANTATTGERDSLEGSDEESSPPPPSPDVAQHDLMRRLSLLLSQRPSPTRTPTPTPTPHPTDRHHGHTSQHPSGAPPPSSPSSSSRHPPHPSSALSGHQRGKGKRDTVVVATSTTSSLSSNEDDDDDDDDDDFTPERCLSDNSPLSVSSGSEQNRVGHPPHLKEVYPDEESQELSSDSLVSLMSLSTTHSVRDHPATKRSHSFVVTYSPLRPPELQLTPIPFEIPHPEGTPLFLGRQWVFREMDMALNREGSSQQPGVVLLGGIGSGKTAILEQLVAHSCFHDTTSTPITTTRFTDHPTLCEPQRNSQDLSPSPTPGALRSVSPCGKSSYLSPYTLAVRNLREDGMGRSSPASSDSSHSSHRTAIYAERSSRVPSPKMTVGNLQEGGTGGSPVPGSDSSRGNDRAAAHGDKISNLPSKRPVAKSPQEEGTDGHSGAVSTSIYSGCGGTDIHSKHQNLPSKMTAAKSVHEGVTGGNLGTTTQWRLSGELSGSRTSEDQAWARESHPVDHRWSGVDGGELEKLGSQVVAYHLCQADINITCLVPDFVHSLAAYMALSPRLQAYRDLLLEEPQLQQLLSLRGCIQNPSAALIKGILEPLKTLESRGKISTDSSLILVDSLNEAEFHRADHGDTIASFLVRHVTLFPSWLKLVVACQTVVQEIVRPLPFLHIHLDKTSSGDDSSDMGARDIQDYIHHRLQNSIPLRSNVCPYGKFDTAAQQKFCSHLQSLSKGCFLHVKLVLDLIEHGHLVVKGASYKILPVNLSEVFLLHFNLKFSSVRAFERVANILAVCLAALYPLCLRTIFLTVNSGYTSRYIAWEDFCSRMTMLSGLLHQRGDGCYMFFHPAFREWLIRRDDSDATKFLCGLRNAEFDYRLGHALMAFRLSRLNAPLTPEKTVELGHHVLKAHIYKGMRRPGGGGGGGGGGGSLTSRELQGLWVCLSSRSLSRALVTARNVFCPNVKVSRLLLTAGANPDARTDYLYYSPLLCVAAKQGFVDMVSLLLEFGADANATSELLGVPPLCYAAAYGHCDILRQLCMHGARPSLPDKMGQSAPVHAALRGQLESLAFLLQLEWRPLPEEPGRDDVTLQCLVAAAGAGHKHIVEYLHQATRGEALDLVDTLFGETPTTAACIQGQSEVLQYILEEGADTSATNSKTLSPLLCAAMFGERQIAESLLAAGADAEQTDKFGRTALIVAASEGQFAVLDLLLTKGAQLERTDQEGLTALCWACLKGHVTSVHALCACGADVNHSDRRGRVPLHLAAYHGDVQLVQYLLDREAQLERIDTHGLSPLERAINRDNIDVVDLFLRSGAKLGPETWTVASGKPDVLLMMLNKLMDDGNRLYKKNRIQEAAQRYRHALKKFPRGRDRERRRKSFQGETLGEEEKRAFRDLKFHFLLNLSRCKLRLHDCTTAVELASHALALKPKCFQAYYARARAYRAAQHLNSAHADLMHALRLAPNNPEVRRLLTRVQEESTPRTSRHYYESDLPSCGADKASDEEDVADLEETNL